MRSNPRRFEVAEFVRIRAMVRRSAAAVSLPANSAALFRSSALPLFRSSALPLALRASFGLRRFIAAFPCRGATFFLS
jgi:hypothetical protein